MRVQYIVCLILPDCAIEHSGSSTSNASVEATPIHNTRLPLFSLGSGRAVSVSASSLAKAGRILAAAEEEHAMCLSDKDRAVDYNATTPASVTAPHTGMGPVRHLSLFTSGSGHSVSVSAASVAKAGRLFAANNTSDDAISRIVGSCEAEEGSYCVYSILCV